MNFLRLLLTFLTLLIYTILPAQDRKCASTEHTEQLLKDPEYQQNYRERMAAFNRVAATKTSSARLDCNNLISIPIAVHFQGVSSTDRSCLEGLVNEQIAALNADFQGSNSDISTWNNATSSLFPGVSNGETCVQFCVATKNHPANYNLADGQMAITINQTSGDRINAWAGYLNIYVQEIGNNILGYSPLGGRGNGDGVVLAKFAFGGSGSCGDVSTSSSLDRGRTLTHEVGHFFSLDHIWGDGGCGIDDGVSDTPNSDQPNYGCPQDGKVGCNSVDMHMNYMDYTNDECMYMFSGGQSTRMESYVQANLQSFINTSALACGAPAEPTCNDGIKNGNETGVDCGGDCAACPEPTCSDGIMNGNETGIDCGGDCSPCINPPTCDDGLMNGNETGVDCGGSCNECPIDCDQNKVYVLIKPDNYGSEITWVLNDENGNEMASGGPYQDFNTTLVEEEVCLPEGCYTFTIFDAFSDGICCQYGIGSYAIVDQAGNIITSSDGVYTDSQAQTFGTGANGCGTNPPPPPADRCTAPEPTTLEYFNNITRVRINWDPIPDANRYQVQYKTEDASSWLRVSTSRTRKTLRNLYTGTNYLIRFRARCADGWTDYSSIYGFATLTGKVTEDVTEQVTIEYEPLEFNRMYPNPASDQLTLDYNLELDGEVTVAVYDMLGRKVISKNIRQEEGHQKVQLNTSDLQHGTYIMQLTVENQQIVRKFIKN